jgi:hypothetical protein
VSGAVGVLLVASCGGSIGPHVGPPFPVPHGVESVREIQVAPDLWRGRIIATEGLVGLVEKDGDHPLLRLDLAQSGGAPLHLWAMFVTVGRPPAEVGQTIRVLGYVVSDREAPLTHLGIGESEARLVAFAAVNLETKKASYYEGGRNQFRQWKSGIVPTAPH